MRRLAFLVLLVAAGCGAGPFKKHPIRMDADGRCWQDDTADMPGGARSGERTETGVPCPKGVATPKPTMTDREWEKAACSEGESWGTGRMCVGEHCSVLQVTPTRWTVTKFKDGCTVDVREYPDGTEWRVLKPTPTPTPFVCPKGYMCQPLPDVHKGGFTFEGNRALFPHTPTPTPIRSLYDDIPTANRGLPYVEFWAPTPTPCAGGKP